jgi:hypothetical protein
MKTEAVWAIRLVERIWMSKDVTSEKDEAPTGKIINSWNASLLPAVFCDKIYVMWYDMMWHYVGSHRPTTDKIVTRGKGGVQLGVEGSQGEREREREGEREGGGQAGEEAGELPACEPPLMMLSAGTGKTKSVLPAKSAMCWYLYRHIV